MIVPPPLLLWALLAAPSPVAAPAALSVLDPAALMALEAAGLTAGRTAFVSPAAHNNAELAADPLYADLVHAVRGDLDALARADKARGVGMRFSHRGFDPRWLTSSDARWELAAVVNRLDRRVFDAGTCGEVRLLYRLSYTTSTRSGPFSSRLPATLNVVYLLPDDHLGCRAAAERFTRPLRDDVLAEASLTPERLKSVEVDLQATRWPSTVRPDLGGHAEYILRVFHRAGRHLAPAPLENTPDVERILADPRLRAAVSTWIHDNLQAIDAGTALLPEGFDATQALSVTPRGLARSQNRPWTRMLRALGDVVQPDALSSTATIRTSGALARRLDGLSCVGCHQSRSLAGFHVVGADRIPSADAIGVGVSPHFEEDQPRRRAYTDALLHGAAVDEHRPPPDRGTDRGTFGDACGLGDAGFAAEGCGAGYHCVAVDDDTVGECMPQVPSVGSACRPGKVDFVRDRIRRTETLACRDDAVCEDVAVGFPGGMCAGACDATHADDHARCGGIAVLTPFNACLARGELFSECAKNVRPAALRACGAGDPCRPDYICAGAAGAGVCLPPYFVLQMRVDGHPPPH